MSYIKNTAGQFLGFLLVSCCGAPVTGATVTAVRSIDGASQASATGTVTELGGGQYNLEMSQADTNGDDITFLFTASGAVPVEKTITTASGGQVNSDGGQAGSCSVNGSASGGAAPGHPLGIGSASGSISTVTGATGGAGL